MNYPKRAADAVNGMKNRIRQSPVVNQSPPGPSFRSLLSSLTTYLEVEESCSASTEAPEILFFLFLLPEVLWQLLNVCLSFIVAFSSISASLLYACQTDLLFIVFSVYM